ncbi:hypothetical protein NQ318_015173, partial [Aromia moschata]
MRFQHDGAPPHRARQWPPKLPDLTPLDFFLKTLKNEVYKTPTRNLEHLKDKIRSACENISRDMLIKASMREVLLVHQGSKISFSRVFDFEASDLNAVEEGCESRTSPFESRFPINVGITGYVATTGETVNLINVDEDPRFDPSVDDGTSFKHKTILCMPIKNSSGHIVGVIQLINKFNDLPFTKNDENFVEAFAIFCGMGIHNTHMYEKAIVAIAKQNVTLEVLSYHATASLEDAQRLRSLRVPSAAHFGLHNFAFDDILMDDDETLTACIRMFLDLDLVERFHMDYEVLCRWLLSVKKNYRNVTYHNWRHAFNVAQMMRHSGGTSLEKLNVSLLMIACLCHDLDHRGTNNSFQIKETIPQKMLIIDAYFTRGGSRIPLSATLRNVKQVLPYTCDGLIKALEVKIEFIKLIPLTTLMPSSAYLIIHIDLVASSPLAQLYSTSTMEHHHFDQCIMILNSPGNQLLSNISPDEYTRGDQGVGGGDPLHGPRVVSEGPCWGLEEHRDLLRAMLMTVCDLAAITKPWDVEKRVAELVSSEFFEQGDIERGEAEDYPNFGFIDSICLPIYESFAVLSDKLEPLVEGVRQNRRKWLEIAAENCLVPETEANEERDDNDNLSKPTTPSRTIIHLQMKIVVRLLPISIE